MIDFASECISATAAAFCIGMAFDKIACSGVELRAKFNALGTSPLWSNRILIGAVETCVTLRNQKTCQIADGHVFVTTLKRY